MSGQGEGATPALDRFRTPSRASKKIAAFNVARGCVFIVVQSLAAMALDGWLSVALWVNAAYNALLLIAMVAGAIAIAVDVQNESRP